MREPYSWGTNFSTGYGHFHQHGVRGVRGTKGTKVRMSMPDDHKDRYGGCHRLATPTYEYIRTNRLVDRETDSDSSF